MTVTEHRQKPNVKRSIFHSWTLLSVLLLGAPVCIAGAADESAGGGGKPNIVVILCDDLGYGDLECYGHPQIKTANLNRMATEGIRFTSFYSAAPVCSPSRVGLLTGRSPNRAGVYDWIPPSGRPQPNVRDLVHMQRDELTIPQLLKQAGYATCMAGKWHCNSKFNEAAQPQPGDFGFDHWLATQNNAAPSHENPVNYVRNGEPVGPLEGFSCQLVVDEASAWLRKQVKEQPDQPFFLFLPFHEPHEPVASPPKLVAKYRSVAKSEDEAQYFANVENVDLAVGRVLKLLSEVDRDQDTLVIFTSDNGPETLNRYRRANRSFGTPGPLRGMKLWTTEAGFRVAGIVRWPARVKPGQVSHQAVSSLDFLPTFCRLAEVEPPKSRILDGTDMLPALKGKTIKRSKPLFWCYFNAINQRRVAMRDGRWKMIASLNHGELPKFTNVHAGNLERISNAKLTDFQLYEVVDDIDESENVIDAHPEVAKRLQTQMRKAYHDLLENGVVWRRDER